MAFPDREREREREKEKENEGHPQLSSNTHLLCDRTNDANITTLLNWISSIRKLNLHFLLLHIECP